MDKDTQKKFAEYTKRRGYARGAFTRLEKSISAFGDNQMDLQDAYVGLEQLERCYRDFEEFDQMIMDIDPNASEIEQFEQKFLKLKAKLRTVIHDTNPLLTAVQKQLNETMTSFTTHQKELLESIRETSMTAVPKEDVKLPRLDIPCFYGKKSEEFQSFKDLFENIVDKNTAMSNCQKLSYLKGLMKGEAYTFIRHISVTDANYKPTWTKVCKRYDQPALVVRSFVKRFFEQPAMSNTNTQSLRRVVDTASEVIAGLKALGGDAESRDIWLNHIILNKLDDDSRRAWATKTVDTKYPTFDSLLDFLEKRCNALETLDIPNKRSVTSKPIHGINSNHAVTSKPNSFPHPSSQTKPPLTITKCRKCGNNHRLQDCEQFKSFDLNQRKEFAASSGCCFNCLAVGHSSKVCRSSRRCQLCHKKHHTTLHQPIDPNIIQADSSTDASSSPSNEITTNISINQAGALQTNPADNANNTQNILQSHVSLFSSPLLPTARVIIRNKFGQSCIGRMLLDSGSNGSMISESCVRRLNLSRINARYPVKGIASKSTTRGLTTIEISPHFHPELKLEMNVYIMKDLPKTLPRANPKLLNEWENFKSHTLADPLDNNNIEIDVVMGVGYFLKILSDGKLEGPNMLTAQNTLFGWIIGGGEAPMPEQQSFNVNFDLNIDQTLRKFWELEEFPTDDHLSLQDQQCEELFRESTYRDDQGRYVVKLPFFPNSPLLGESLTQALSRFSSIEKKLQSNHNLREEYVKFMDEYINLNHMEELTAEDLSVPSTHHFYLPHHPIIKETSITTKVRVVFDGSATSKSSVSLNKILMVGPTVQPDLISIIMRFRLHRIAFTSDIEKMYRQIKVHPDHVNYQRIVWRKSPIEPLKHFKLKTVTYGTTPAAFLATRSLLQLARDEEKTQPDASYVISNEFYVDDVLSGADSTEEAIKLSKQLQQVLMSAGFQLHKWTSNSKEFLTTIETKNPVTTIEMMKGCAQKVLGLHWNYEKDYFTFKVNMIYDNAKLTKRKLLSDASRLFDPLGWLSPMVITVKMLFQQIWLLSIEWDDILPSEIVDAWNNIKREINQIESINIPRYIHFNDECLELHGFCDASKTAYAAAIYLRAIDQSGKVQITLIAAKTKVAPIRRVTIPRLELLAAHLLAKLSKSIIQTLKVFDIPSYSWTDSEIVLHWLAKQPSTWPTFIANRTAQIHEWLPNTMWRYVNTKSNPCDCASRGLMPSELVQHSLWWRGPDWLYHEKTIWPRQKLTTLSYDQELSEKSTVHIHEAVVEIDVISTLFDNISDYRTIKRTLGFCVRFIRLSQQHRRKTRSLVSTAVDIESVLPLTCDELKLAEQYIWRWAQQSDFESEIKMLAIGKAIKKSSILSLSPFLDNQSILRVGGRLKNASCSVGAKHQVILPRSHRLCQAILKSMHKTYLHPTAATLFNLSRQKYWIIGGKVLAKKITNDCKVCFKLKSQPKPQIMGDLPAVRTTPTRCFSKVGLDYAGPFQIVIRRGRAKAPVKAYVAVFICMVTKAIHLEAVMDLSTDTFIAALRRFISRRNAPTDIYSDNGTNFKGARHKLTELEQVLQNSARNKTITDFLTGKGTQWHFIPPASPSMGGLWEAGVKCMKHHLIRATENAILSLDEFSTLLCEIEAILNSRPLIPCSIDPNDDMPLTPAHFLLTEPLESLPDEELLSVAENRLDRWQNVQKRVQGYWQRFSREYLHTLQQRKKWSQQEINLKIGDLVYIKDENTPPLHWPLGRIINVFPGKDNIVRVVTVKTRSTTLKRPVTKL